MDREELDKKLWIIREATGKFNADAGDAIAEILAEFDRLEALLREETRCRMEGWGKVVELRKENERLNTGNAYLLLQLEQICEPLKKFSTEELRRHNPYLPHDDAEHGTLWSVIERICDYLDSQGKDSQQEPDPLCPQCSRKATLLTTGNIWCDDCYQEISPKPDILSTEATLRRMIEDKCAFCEKPHTVTKYVCSQCGEEMGGITDDCKPKEVQVSEYDEEQRCIGYGLAISHFNLLVALEKPKDEEVLRGILDSHWPMHDGMQDAAIRAAIIDIKEHFQLIKEGTTTKTVSTWTE